MFPDESILVVARHGETQRVAGQDPSNYPLTDEAVLGHYNVIKEILGGVDPRKFLAFSGTKPCTVQAACAFYCGACESGADLGRPNGKPIALQKFLKLDTDDILVNRAHFARDRENYLKRWISNPSRTEYDGEPITSFDFVAETRARIVPTMIRKLLTEGMRAGAIVTHSGIAEALLIGCISSSLHPGEDLARIGGLFDNGDCAYMRIPRRGDRQLVFQRGANEYPTILTTGTLKYKLASKGK